MAEEKEGEEVSEIFPEYAIAFFFGVGIGCSALFVGTAINFGLSLLIRVVCPIAPLSARR